MKRHATALVILGLVTSLIASLAEWSRYEHLGFFADDIQATNFYMLFDSISKLAIVTAFYVSLNERSVLKMLLFLAILFCAGEILDELIFDPTRMQLNEILQIIIGLIYAVYYGRKTLSSK